ncbi:MAG: carboxypeptidase regulatory-like domain-containing protein [Bryobacteraceae bacterium]|nr:carboxypeptidase regulatory-like domain-containing protein [Bryobacteraceae bacterium]
MQKQEWNRCRARRGLLTCAAASLLAFGAGCGGERTEQAQEQPGAEGGAVWKPTGQEGSVTGKINFQGQPPKYRAILMDADSVCAAQHSGPVYPDSVVVNNNGTLRNVFVYVKSGLEGKSFEVPSDSVELDQEGCIYKPHVLGIQARQQLKVVTSDNTTHNIHPIPKVNREWNVSQPPGADPIMQTFSRPETSIPVKCNQHPWMRAYIHVMGHPFYAVSGDDGSFKIEGLPAGEYELEAVHEEYGATTQKVTVAANQPSAADFGFNAKQAYGPSSLKMMPALALSCCAHGSD